MAQCASSRVSRWTWTTKARTTLTCSLPGRPLLLTGRRGPQEIRLAPRPSQARNRRKLQVRAEVAPAGGTEAFLQWMSDNGSSQERITLADRPDSEDSIHSLKSMHYIVAAQDIESGEEAIRIPDSMYITLEQIFQDETVAELLTTNKLSELAVLALYLMYEKKNGEESVWSEYIHELDRQAARGQNAVPSPLLWDPEEVTTLLKGSTVISSIKSRLKAIEREYQELDTVWFMAGSLFQNYPYDIPTEAFSLELFTQAFVVVLSCVVHLQGVKLARRFALVPLGPPLLSYSTTSKNMLTPQEDQSISLKLSTPCKEGDSLEVWCGPQPNSRLLLNYGFVDMGNPYDKLTVRATISKADELFQAKKAALQTMDLGTTQDFNLKRDDDIAQNKLLSFLRLGQATTEEDVRAISSEVSSQDNDSSATPVHDISVLAHVYSFCSNHLQGYDRLLEEDEALLASNALDPKERVATQLLCCEKRILKSTMASLSAVTEEGVDLGSTNPAVFTSHCSLKML
mmetsp:Transcript_22220/g.26682  ORF Transcript_22220/g.26682 Transcript_22220/m.26682 type:complete len:514 (-) Transcript_22220:122-1663(-)|eukprot:CAMPEP_0197862556 /NCGR_PEP_ID=MMETSP1438-20131217/39412_1 /TAXON_ID=1461541 /ORGANISM="Pterosperma sp., Strain CCMP1384" /LENGTH=513 /DNA_ID=CAMNT_0043480153 /DNA_START=29 /DNA_END=1570 /DNA_ORIENTATION=-